MTPQEILAQVPGAASVAEWFGRWPGFHDAEVTGIFLERTGISRLCLHAFNMTKDLDERGYFVTEKHAMVNFLFQDVTNTQLTGFNHQNVIFGLEVEKTSDGFGVLLEDCYGVSGRIDARVLTVELKPGVPVGSVYAKSSTQGVSSA